MVPVPAPTQGVKSRREKTKLMEKQRESSICVKLLKKVEKSVIEEALTNVHTGIDKICFPRQKVPRYNNSLISFLLFSDQMLEFAKTKKKLQCFRAPRVD